MEYICATYTGGRASVFPTRSKLLVFSTQPFKFAYCLRLIDAGLIEKAYRYLEVLGTSLAALLEDQEESAEGSELAPVDLRALFLMTSQCLRLAERLRLHPEVGSFESVEPGEEAGLGGVSCLPWMHRLARVYQHVCEEVSSLVALS